MSGQVEGLRRFVGTRGAAPWRPADRPVIVVAGATGGAGASTVAALLALASAQGGRRTLLVDTDEVVGVQHRILGISASLGISALQDPRISVGDVLAAVTTECDLMPGGHAGDPSPVPFDTTARRMVMRRLAQRYEAFDAIVIDAGSRLDGILAAAEPGVSRFLVVSGITPVAIASAYAIAKTADSRWRGVEVELLVNRHAPEAGRVAYEQVLTATRQFLRRAVGFAGVLPDDPSLREVPAAPLVRCSRGVELALQQLAAALLAHTDAAVGA